MPLASTSTSPRDEWPVEAAMELEFAIGAAATDFGVGDDDEYDAPLPHAASAIAPNAPSATKRGKRIGALLHPVGARFRNGELFNQYVGERRAVLGSAE